MNQMEQSTGQEPVDTTITSNTSESVFPQSGARILTEAQVKESAVRLQNEVNESIEKKKRRGRPPKNKVSDIPRQTVSSQNVSSIQVKPLSPAIPIEVIKPWLKSGFDFAATVRKCDAYKLPDDTATSLAEQTQIILQHLDANINPFYAACFSALTIAGMHLYGAYTIEKMILEEKEKQNALSA